VLDGGAGGHGEQDGTVDGQVARGALSRNAADGDVRASQTLHDVGSEVVGDDAVLQERVEGAEPDEDRCAAGAMAGWAVGVGVAGERGGHGDG